MPTGLTYAEMAEREISYWESSSDDSDSDSDSNNWNRNRNRKANASKNGSRPNSLTISHARHLANVNERGHKDEEGGKEVIFDLDPTAMSQLPSHLQHNMREIQRERLARMKRENVHVPVRKQQQQQQHNAADESKEEQDQADRWFRNLLAKLSGAAGMRMKVRHRRKSIRARGISSPRPVDLDVLRRVYEGGDQSKEFIEPRHIENEHLPGHKDVGVEHEKDVDLDHAYATAHAQGHRAHRAASNMDRIYDHSDEVPHHSEPFLPNLDNQYFIGQSKFYEGDPQQGEQDEASRSSAQEQDQVKTSSLRRCVHKSMHKLSKAFKKG